MRKCPDCGEPFEEWYLTLHGFTAQALTCKSCWGDGDANQQWGTRISLKWLQ